MDPYQYIRSIGQKAKKASDHFKHLSSHQKNQLLAEMMKALIANQEEIIEANKIDVKTAQSKGVSDALVERLTLSPRRFNEMVEGIAQVIQLKDPVGHIEDMWLNDEGMQIGKKSVPIGVIGMIYESRPNVTIDAATLCLKTGNVVILKGGSDALMTNMALVKAICPVFQLFDLPTDCVQLVESTDRNVVKELLTCTKYIDCIIPRGGAGLIEFVVQNAKVPVIETGAGNCHIFVDASYDINQAISIIDNAKIQRPGACNAVETVLLHEQIAPGLLPDLVKFLTDKSVELYLCPQALLMLNTPNHLVFPANENDWSTEYLDYKLAIKIVKNMNEAIDHINTYSTGHSEAILTHHYDHAQTFLDKVDSAAVYVNASTRFTDGSAFGFGAEIGISTQKLHARGPMGLNALTSNKYVIYGNGNIRK